jgi:hypothetical protein
MIEMLIEILRAFCISLITLIIVLGFAIIIFLMTIYLTGIEAIAFLLFCLFVVIFFFVYSGIKIDEK